jgi:hypothetical protein
MILNVTVFFVRVCGGKYRDELFLNFTLFVVRVWVWQYRDEKFLNVTLFVVRVWGGKCRENACECYCVYCEDLGREI